MRYVEFRLIRIKTRSEKGCTMTQLNPNDALVDYAGILKTVGDLQDEFSLLNLLDYCAIVEGLVLHDRLVMVGATEHSKSKDSRFAVKIAEKLAPWLSANVLIYDPDPAPIQDVRRLTNDLVTIGNRTRSGRTLDAKLEDAFFESGEKQGTDPARLAWGMLALFASTTADSIRKIDWD
jgi:hypothetical protein